MAFHNFTHIGTISGDARAGGRSFRIKLRLTPSGSHWVDKLGRRYRRTGGGYTGDKWPMYFLDASSIEEITAQGIEAREGQDAKRLDRNDESPVAESDAPKPNHIGETNDR